jgi:hypothetical protein
MDAEGWYLDPYKKHTDRWFSSGQPTKLVRDDGIESYDPPPDEPVSVPLVESPEKEPHDGADLRRADDSELKGVFRNEWGAGVPVRDLSIHH